MVWPSHAKWPVGMTPDMSNEGASRQFRRDMERATAAFTELGADKQKMYELLRKWFGVDSMEEADSYIRDGAQFEYPHDTARRIPET